MRLKHNINKYKVNFKTQNEIRNAKHNIYEIKNMKHN